VQEVHLHAIAAEDQSAAQIVGDLCRASGKPSIFLVTGR
jgi:hypothetical protein